MEEDERYDFGLIGLGTMGRNFVYNICDHGFSVAGFDKDNSKLEELEKEKGSKKAFGAKDIPEFLSKLVIPRVILLLVPSGPVVDTVIAELKPLLSLNDLLIDCGNSHFTDTDRRIVQLAKENIRFMGVGISGGEYGARYGPSIMPGGEFESYKRVAAMFEAVSAKVGTVSCVEYMGPGSAGHYVKMVHNGIEYALMQMISESYHLLKQVAGFGNEELHAVFSKWNEGMIQSYLIEITATIFEQKDDLTNVYLVDKILDSAHQKGTGMWMSQNAMDLKVPVPSIDAAVSARDLSELKAGRVAASRILPGVPNQNEVDKDELISWLEQALCFSMISAYAQGFSLMIAGSAEYQYHLKPENIAKIWRGGCIIRSAILETIETAFKQEPDLTNLMLNGALTKKLSETQQGLRRVVRLAVESGIPVPVFGASLSYFDGYRTERLPSNLLQAQRDYFGAHTYQRTDRPGNFHTNWK